MNGERDRFTYVVQRRAGGVSVIGATGDLDGDTHVLMYQVVADELARRPTRLVLELAGATSVDGAALEALLGVSALAGESDTSFCLVAPAAGPVVTALVAADLIERFEVFATLADAERHE